MQRHCLDQRKIREGLGTVAEMLADRGFDLLRVEQERPGERQQLLAQSARTVGLADQGQRGANAVTPFGRTPPGYSPRPWMRRQPGSRPRYGGGPVDDLLRCPPAPSCGCAGSQRPNSGAENDAGSCQQHRPADGGPVGHVTGDRPVSVLAPPDKESPLGLDGVAAATREPIDTEARKIIEECYEQALATLRLRRRAHRPDNRSRRDRPAARQALPRQRRRGRPRQSRRIAGRPPLPRAREPGSRSERTTGQEAPAVTGKGPFMPEPPQTGRRGSG